jgi:hypothetical protein
MGRRAPSVSDSAPKKIIQKTSAESLYESFVFVCWSRVVFKSIFAVTGDAFSPLILAFSGFQL